MAWEAPQQILTFPTATTGLVRYQFASLTTAGNVIAATTNTQPLGVIQDGTTNSTVDPTHISVMVAGVSKLKLDTASTVAVSDIVSASTVGAKAPAAGDVVAGLIVAGASGGAGRLVSVLIAAPTGSTAIN